MIKFLIKKSQRTVVPGFFSCEGEDKSVMYAPATESLKKQIQSLSISADIQVLNIEDFPQRVDSFLVSILDENSVIPDDYVARVLAMNNLHRDFSLFCGPVKPYFSLKPASAINAALLNMYKLYNYESFSSFISCSLNGDHNHYPCITGCVISGHAYNMAHGYTCNKTPRSILENNKNFFKLIENIGPMIYSARLGTFYYITSDEARPDNLIKYWYEVGFENGQIDKINSSSIRNQSKELAQLEMQNIPESDSMINACKCMYTVGYYEALTSSKII